MPDSFAYPIFILIPAFLGIALFLLAEKRLRLAACRVRITISAMGNSFFVFWEFLSLAVEEGFFNFSGTWSTHSACVGAYIHPPPGIHAGRYRGSPPPHGFPLPRLNADL
nr:MAG TPA: hypothetical protein [Bacteriophage sp.]